MQVILYWVQSSAKRRQIVLGALEKVAVDYKKEQKTTMSQESKVYSAKHLSWCSGQGTSAKQLK